MKKAKIDLSFGWRMKALKWAREQIRKEKALTDEMFKPLDPLDRQVTASLNMKPLEVTAPTLAENQNIEIKVTTAMERAVQRLREQANKIKL